MGFLKPDSGRVMVPRGHHRLQRGTDGRNPQESHYGLSERALFDSLTVLENVAFPLRESRGLNEEQIFQIVDGLLQMLGAGDAHLLPSDLSTGMKRSVAIARALAAQPECVLYDEPRPWWTTHAQLLGDLIKR